MRKMGIKTKIREGNGSDRIRFLEIQTRFIIFRFGSSPGPENEDLNPICSVFSGFDSGSGLIQIFTKIKLSKYYISIKIVIIDFFSSKYTNIKKGIIGFI